MHRYQTNLKMLSRWEACQSNGDPRASLRLTCEIQARYKYYQCMDEHYSLLPGNQLYYNMELHVVNGMGL